MADRKYLMRKRAEGQDATRERIVEATAALHSEQGVAATSYLQIAERAGVGAATVYRHFPTLGSLVMARCRRRRPPSLPALAPGSSDWNDSLPNSTLSMSGAPPGWGSRPATATAFLSLIASCARSMPGWRRWCAKRWRPVLQKPRSGS